MKLLDILYEDENREKLIKKAKTIYKAFKRGKLKVDNHGQSEDALFSYTLSDDPTIIKFENLSEDTDVFIKCEIYIKCLSEIANQTTVLLVQKHVKNRFKQHGIDIKIQMWTYNIEPYLKPIEPINEGLSHQNVDSSDLNAEQLKDLKKAKTIFKALKKGSINFKSEERGELLLTYEVKGPYWYWEWTAGKEVFRVEFNHVEVHTTNSNLYQDFISKNFEKGWNKTARGIIEDHVVGPHIRKKFKKFNIDVRNIDHVKIVLDEPQPINEDADVDVPKEKRRVKTVFKALRSGVMFVPFLGYKIKYELNNDYQLSVGIGKSHNDTILFVPSDDKTPKIKLYEIGSDGVERYFEVNGYDSIYQMMWQKISDRFKHFHIHLR